MSPTPPATSPTYSPTPPSLKSLTPPIFADDTVEKWQSNGLSFEAINRIAGRVKRRNDEHKVLKRKFQELTHKFLPWQLQQFTYLISTLYNIEKHTKSMLLDKLIGLIQKRHTRDMHKAAIQSFSTILLKSFTIVKFS